MYIPYLLILTVSGLGVIIRAKFKKLLHRHFYIYYYYMFCYSVKIRSCNLTLLHTTTGNADKSAMPWNVKFQYQSFI